MSASEEQKYVALDLEMNQPSGRIIQVGIAIGSAAMPETEYLVRDWLITIDEPMNPEITDLTGISDADLRERGVPLQQCAQELSSLLAEQRPFVNPVVWGGGDSAELLAEFRAAAIDFPHFGHRWIDTKTWAIYLALARPGSPQSTKGGLRSIMQRFGLKFIGVQHRAPDDALNTLRLFYRLLERQQRLERLAILAREI